jgi:hypothetical protein
LAVELLLFLSRRSFGGLASSFARFNGFDDRGVIAVQGTIRDTLLIDGIAELE